MRPLDVFAELLSPRCILVPDDRLVLGALVICADNGTGDAGVLYVGTLCEMTGRSESTVQRSIRRLAARDLVTRRKRKTGAGDHAPSAYALTLRWAGLYGPHHAAPLPEPSELDQGEELRAAWAELRAITAERDDLYARLVAVTAERDELRALLAEAPKAEELPGDAPKAEELPELPDAQADAGPRGGPGMPGGGGARQGGVSGAGGGVRETPISARNDLPLALPCAAGTAPAPAPAELGRSGRVVPGPGMADALLRALLARPALVPIACSAMAEHLSHAAAVVGLPLAVQAFDELAGKAGAAAAIGRAWTLERLAGAAWAFIEGKQEGRRHAGPGTSALQPPGTWRPSLPLARGETDPTGPAEAWREDYDPAEAGKTAAREKAWKKQKEREATDLARAAVIIAGRVPFMADWLEEQRQHAQRVAVENRAKRAEAERGRDEAERTAREEQQRRRRDAVTETFAPVVGVPRLIDGAWIVE